MNILLSGDKNFVKSISEGTHIFIEESALAKQELPDLSITLTYASDNTISVCKTGSLCSISCSDPAHYFKVLNELLHHPNEDFEKHESAAFSKNGFMLDCSRNAVATVNKTKSIIRTIAKMGMNQLFLYMEDTYEVPSLPYFGAYRGRYSKDELRELDSYAEIFGIELIPCVQTLAHLRNALRWPAMHYLRDTEDILNVGSEKTYAFIEELLVSLKECFKTRNIHIGMDEAAMLGLGNYLRENGYRESSALIKKHSDKVLEICKKHGWKPMIWSDMYISSNTGTGYYSCNENTDTSAWVKPDKDLALVYWDYYHNEEKIYMDTLRVHKEIAGRTIFAGGIWTWNGIAPNYGKAFQCTINALSACRKSGIQEVFATAWLDNGAETPFDAMYPGLALFSYLDFHSEFDLEKFTQYFEDCIDARLTDFCLLDEFDSVFQGSGKNLTCDMPSKILLYQDSMLGMFDYHLQGVDTAGYYIKLSHKLKQAAKTSPKYEDLFLFYSALADVLSQKADLGIRIKEAYDANDLSTLSNICEEVIPTLLADLQDMHLLWETLWLKNAKPFGYELLDIRLGAIRTRLESHVRRIRAYLQKEVDFLEELEQKRLPYWAIEPQYPHADTVGLSLNYWDRIVSACGVVDTL